MIQDHFDVESWEQVAFGKVVLNKNENTSDPSLEGLSRVVGLDHMDSESLPLVRWSELGDLPDGTTFTRRFHAGQVLFGKRRSYQKKVSFPDFDGVCSGDILVFESLDSKRLLPGFLPLLVQSDPFMDFAISTSAGSLSPRTKWSDLSKFEFFLPSLKNQEEIVEVISAIDMTIESYQNMSLYSYRESIVHELLSSSDEKVTQTTLGEIGIAGMFTDGDWVESKDQDPLGEFRLLQLADIGDGVFLDKSNRWMNMEQFNRLRCTSLKAQDILIARMPDPIARACILPSGLPTCATVVDVAILRCSEGYVPEFVLLVINDSTFRAEAESLLAGTTRQRISRSNLAKIDFSVPSLAEQKRVVEIVSSVDAVVQSTEQAIADAKALRRSILGEVFKDHNRA